jgi:hypothetical protein
LRWQSLWTWLARTPAMRRTAEMVFRAGARRHIAGLDEEPPARRQARVLLGLVHQARGTRFGRQHDFDRLRNVGDFRRLVPLTTRAGLWRDYWEVAFPFLAGASWPGPVAPIPGPRGPDTIPRPVCLSPTLQAAHRAGLRTALALVTDQIPHLRLLDGDILLLRDDMTGHYPDPAALMRERLPSWLRPYSRRDASNVVAVAEKLTSEPVSCIVGPAESVVDIADDLRRRRGVKCLQHICPLLAVVVYSACSTEARVRLHEAAGRGVLLVESVMWPEGPVAVEDHRLSAFRLLTEHGVFFEFVAACADHASPRLGLNAVQPGIPYELVLTSPAGLWACRMGRAVSFERTDPPAIKFVDMPAAPVLSEACSATAASQLVPAPRPQSTGSLVGLPEMPSHSLLSTFAGRE